MRIAVITLGLEHRLPSAVFGTACGVQLADMEQRR